MEIEAVDGGGGGGNVTTLASVHSISWSSEKENNAIAPGSHHGTMVAKLWTPEDPRSLLRISQQQQQQQESGLGGGGGGGGGGLFLSSQHQQHHIN